MLKIVLLVVIATGCCLAREIVSINGENRNGTIQDLVGLRAAALDHCAGRVKKDGSIRESFPSNCFHVTKTKKGIYEIYFKNGPLSDSPVCTVTQVFPVSFSGDGGDTKDNAVIMNVDAYKMFYVTGKSNGDRTDRESMFMCVWD